jgi:hypothetical protein
MRHKPPIASSPLSQWVRSLLWSRGPHKVGRPDQVEGVVVANAVLGAARLKAPTFGDLAASYLELHAK